LICLAILYFQECFVFVSGGSADGAHSRQFADAQLPVFAGGIVAKKGGRDDLFAHLRTPDLPPFGTGKDGKL